MSNNESVIEENVKSPSDIRSFFENKIKENEIGNKKIEKRGKELNKNNISRINRIKINENKTNENKTNENKINDNKINENKINDNKINENKINDNKINENKINENKINDNKIYDNKINDNKIYENEQYNIRNTRHKPRQPSEIVLEENNIEENINNDINSNMEIDLSSMSESAIENFRKDLGKVNILVTGKTGVGKSTLINAIFNENLADTGIGKPITQEIQKYSKEGYPISIIDTKGLELENYDNIINDIKNYIISHKKSNDKHEQIHVAWVCINECGCRFEDAEYSLIEMLSSESIPVIVILTKCFTEDTGLQKVIEQECKKCRRCHDCVINEEKYLKEKKEDNNGQIYYNKHAKNECPLCNNCKVCPNFKSIAKKVIRVQAIPLKITENITIEPKNLNILTDSTNAVLEEGMKNAFATAQKVDLELKRKRSLISLINFINYRKKEDNLLHIKDIIPEYSVKVVTDISGIYGLELNKTNIDSIISVIMGGKKLSLKGIYTSILSFIHITNKKKVSREESFEMVKKMGEMYIDVLEIVFSNLNEENQQPSIEEIIKLIKQRMHK